MGKLTVFVSYLDLPIRDANRNGADVVMPYDGRLVDMIVDKFASLLFAFNDRIVVQLGI